MTFVIFLPNVLVINMLFLHLHHMTGEELKRAVNVDSRKVEDLASLLGVSRNHLYILFKEQVVPEKYVVKAGEIGLKAPAIPDSKPVPYYDLDATAGNVTVFNEEKTEYVKQYLSVPAFADCDMYINISGNSMYPKYCSGEMVALKKITDLDVVAFGEAYVIVTKEQRFLKYLTKGTDKQHWKLKSENEADYEEFEVPVKKVLHLYLVKGKISKNVI